ncbi:hypothetical protein ACHAQA_005293 [Verticillium albo-atrum]
MIRTQDWDEAINLADKFVAQLTLTEKIGMVQGNSSVGPCIGNIGGVPRLGFRGLCMVNGPNGLNRADQHVQMGPFSSPQSTPPPFTTFRTLALRTERLSRSK